MVHESDNGRVILVLQTDSKQHLKKVSSRDAALTRQHCVCVCVCRWSQ